MNNVRIVHDNIRIVYSKLNIYTLCIWLLYFVMIRGEEYGEPMFAYRCRIKLVGLTVSMKAQTECHYSTGRINITDNRAASYAFKADVTTAPRFHVLRTPRFSMPMPSNEYYYYYRGSFLVSILKQLWREASISTAQCIVTRKMSQGSILKL